MNEFTTEDFTAYFETLPANKLELYFWLDSDRLLNPVLREFYFRTRRVREERRMRVESTPTGVIEEAFDAMFWQACPYSHPVIGWPSDVESITRARAEDYYAKFYGPNNVTAVGGGRFEPERTRALARSTSPHPEATATPPEMITSRSVSRPGRHEREADTNPRSPSGSTPCFRHKDLYALQVAAQLLSRRTGRLYKALVEGQQVAVGEPYAAARPMKYEGMFEVGAEVKDGHAPERSRGPLLAELALLADKPVDDRAPEGQEPGPRQLVPPPREHMSLLIPSS